jgi:hypothetical protein
LPIPSHVQVKTLDLDLATLPLNALLTAAFVTYLPAHPEDVRARVAGGWMQHLGLEVGMDDYYI